MNDKFSTAPFGLPGRFIIREFFLVPHTALETIELTVILKLSARITSSNPDSLFSITSIVKRPFAISSGKSKTDQSKPKLLSSATVPTGVVYSVFRQRNISSFCSD